MRINLTLAALASTVLFAAAPAPVVCQGDDSNAKVQAKKQAAPADKVWVPIATAMEKPLNTQVYIRAKLVSKIEPDPNSSQPYSLYLSDKDGGTARLVVFANIWQGIANKELLEPGVTLEVCATVSEYKNNRQLTLPYSNYIRLKPGSSLPDSVFRDKPAEAEGGFEEASIGSITIAAIGHKVRVKGKVMQIEPSTAPRVPEKVTLKDATGEIEVIYWTDTIKKLTDATRPAKGENWQAAGTVSEFRGKLQVKVTDASTIGKPAN